MCAALTPNFCIFGTNTGVIYHYDIENWNLVNTIKHKVIFILTIFLIVFHSHFPNLYYIYIYI